MSLIIAEIKETVAKVAAKSNQTSPQVCSRCKANLAQESANITPAEEDPDAWARMIYESLACFASGALLGIMYGIIQD